MSGLLSGRRALVTGAGGALGRASSVRFAREGAAVAVVDRRTGASLPAAGTGRGPLGIVRAGR